MTPTTVSKPEEDTAQQEPNYELLRVRGWIIGMSYGCYCVAWRDRDEVVFEWRDSDWYRITGRANPTL
jgi:hypothetical protein